MRTALLFSGQATQYVGMGRYLYDTFPEARAIFEEADDALGESLTALIFGGPAETLDLTANTQPAVLTVACAGWAVLNARGFRPTVMAGHSLGEYAALVAANVLAFSEAVRICRRRGELMQSAASPGVGAMAAIQRLDDIIIEEVCRRASGICCPAVYNAPKVVVISGERDAITWACSQLEEAGGIVTPLRVSAPFHSPLVEPAGSALRTLLDGVSLRSPDIPYVANVNAQWVTHADGAKIKELLVEQVSAPVLWRHSLEAMLEAGIERFWQVGPGRSNLTHIKRLVRRIDCGSMDREKDLNAILGAIQ